MDARNLKTGNVSHRVTATLRCNHQAGRDVVEVVDIKSISEVQIAMIWLGAKALQKVPLEYASTA